ncbi:adenylate-forming enzyme AfeA [Histoplasma capsulatum H143]|uniref:Adenylate-forming enzyme AfeA n=1 Tax=Ajellomyces capsulatus (strain H143) TaxID=544712 RepID=C6HLN5_AJECH|nr:adenylate-forming enzyme AfeA [Histoplasma capsulatum H143]
MEYFKPEQYANLPSNDVLSWIFDNPSYDQDKPVYIDAKDPSNSISCNQARKIIRQLIAGLRAAGFEKGDCLNIHAFNDIYYSMIFLATIGAGGVFAGTNPGYTQFELTHHIKTAKVSFLISEPEILDNLVAAANDTKIPASNIWVFNTQGRPLPPGHKSWTELLKHGEADWVRFNDPETCKNTAAARLFSSGTTGLPKAANISHQNFIAQHTVVDEYRTAKYQISRVIALPCFHAAAVPSTHVGALKAGHTLYIMRRFELLPFLEAADKYNVTDVSTVPPMAVAIVKSPYAKASYLKKTRNGAVGAAPLDKDVQSAFRSIMGPGATYTQVWGMTETTCIATMFRYPENDDTGSVGRPVASLEMKAKTSPPTTCAAKSACAAPRSSKDTSKTPSANAQSFDGEWFKTGDIGYCDEKTKKWYIIDRKKELIKVRGFQVAPPELEAVLLSHPLIMDAAVIGVSFKGGEKEKIEHPRAYVVRQPGPASQKLTEKELQEFAGAKLARYKYLTGGVKFVSSIPKNASGKILKRLLREEAKKEIEQGLVAKL